MPMNLNNFKWPQDEEEPRSRTPETRRILVLNSPAPSNPVAPSKSSTERNWHIYPCGLAIIRLVWNYCVSNSDRSVVETPKTRRFWRSNEAEKFVRIVGQVQKKRRPSQIETHSTGHTYWDGSRYMFENVLTIYDERASHTHTGRERKKQRAACLFTNMRGPIFDLFHKKYFPYIYTFKTCIYMFYMIDLTCIWLGHFGSIFEAQA